MTPAERARADQIRAALTEALVEECTCGDCPTDAALRAALTLDDEGLLRLTR